jgi:hypothetical protein
MGLSHVGINVPPSKFDETVKFYLTALAPLGYKELLRPSEQVVVLGEYYPEFWIGAREDASSEQHVHLAFSANSMYCFLLAHVPFWTQTSELASQCLV